MIEVAGGWEEQQGETGGKTKLIAHAKATAQHRGRVMTRRRRAQRVPTPPEDRNTCGVGVRIADKFVSLQINAVRRRPQFSAIFRASAVNVVCLRRLGRSAPHDDSLACLLSTVCPRRFATSLSATRLSHPVMIWITKNVYHTVEVKDDQFDNPSRPEIIWQNSPRSSPRGCRTQPQHHS